MSQWKVIGDVPNAFCGYRAIVDAVGHTVCSPSPMGDANARLIAAAPEMLAALAELVAEADNPHGWDGHPHPNTLGFQLARAAIEKATQ